MRDLKEASAPETDQATQGLAAIWFRLAIHLVGGNKMVLIMVGGAVGSYLRYLIGRWCGTLSIGQGFPLGTFIINVTGSFVLALAAVVILERLPPEHEGWFLLIGTGFCGGFTTFSSFEWETFKLVRDGSIGLAFLNAVGSLVVGFVAVLCAVSVGSLIFPRR